MASGNPYGVLANSEPVGNIKIQLVGNEINYPETEVYHYFARLTRGADVSVRLSVWCAEYRILGTQEGHKGQVTS